MAERLGVAPGAVALAWTLRNPAVDAAIVGLRRPGPFYHRMLQGHAPLSDHFAHTIVRHVVAALSWPTVASLRSDSDP